MDSIGADEQFEEDKIVLQAQAALDAQEEGADGAEGPANGEDTEMNGQ